MKKYKYTQLLEISLAFALEKIERLENLKPPLIPDEDPVVPYTVIKASPHTRPEPYVSYAQACEIEAANFYKTDPYKIFFGLGPKNGRTGEVLDILETTPYSVKATFRKNNSPENEAYFATMKQVQEEVANYPESKRAGVLSEPETGQAVVDAMKTFGEIERGEEPLPAYLSRVKPHLPETIAWCHKTLEGYPPVGEMIDKLKAKLELGNQALGKKLKVGKDTIVSWRANPQQFHNPYKIVNLIALYNEHFSVPEFWSAISSFEQGQQSTLSETSVGCIKVGEEIITEKPTPPLFVAPPKALQKAPRLMQHTDSVELLKGFITA